MDRMKARDRALEIVEDSRFVTISTIDAEHFPSSRVMFNLRSRKHYPHVDRTLFGEDRDFTLYLGTNTSSEKVAHMKRDDRISAYFSDLETWEGVLLSGRAEFVDDLSVKRMLWDDSWTAYYKYGVEDPDFFVFRLIPLKMETYGQLNVFKFTGDELNGD